MHVNSTCTDRKKHAAFAHVTATMLINGKYGKLSVLMKYIWKGKGDFRLSCGNILNSAKLCNRPPIKQKLIF